MRAEDGANLRAAMLLVSDVLNRNGANPNELDPMFEKRLCDIISSLYGALLIIEEEEDNENESQ